MNIYIVSNKKQQRHIEQIMTDTVSTLVGCLMSNSCRKLN